MTRSEYVIELSGRSTKLTDGDRDNFLSLLRQWLKLGGWVMAVMGTLITIRVLLIMFGFMTK